MSLPPAAKKALTIILREKSLTSVKAYKAVDAAFAAVGWTNPEGDVLPLAKDLTPAQRALFEALATRDGHDLARFGVPDVRLREWLGLAKPGVLEKPVTFTFEKKKLTEPLWRALRRYEEAGDEDATRAFLKKLPIATRLEAFGEVNAHGYEKPYRLESETLFDYRDEKLLGRLRAEGKRWAPRFADRLLELEPRYRNEDVRWPVFLALVRAKVAIEPRWDELLPLGFGVYAKLTEECIRAIPEERRDRAIAAALDYQSLYLAEVGVPLLAKFPSLVLAQKILAEGLDSDRYPKHRVLADMKKIAEKHGVVKKALDPFLKGQPAPLALHCTRAWKPRSARELDATQKKQLEVAARRYDGRKRSAAELLAPSKNEGDSFHGFFEIRHLATADGKPAYDALLYMVDSGTIFRAGTTKAVASIIQSGIEMETKDAPLADGLAIVLEKR